MSNTFVQDYEPVVFRKKTQTEIAQKDTNTVQKQRSIGKYINSKSDIDMRKIEREQIKPAIITLEMRKMIQETRNTKGWTQEDLAKNCGLPRDVIKNYENGKAIVKQFELDKINKVLGLKLKKPKAIKMDPEN